MDGLTDLRIRNLARGEAPPLDLLLLADPSPELVAGYVARGRLFLASAGDVVVGVAVLLWTRPATLELVNLAVRPDWQRQGIGRRLVLAAIDRARAAGAHTLELGTGNSSIGQLALYQRCGFRIVGVDRDFFVRHYPQPIVEDGIPCRDMIRLALELQRPAAEA